MKSEVRARWKPAATVMVAAKLGLRIAALRKQRGWTQEQFAHKCNFHRGFMGQIERGESNVQLKTLLAITNSLNITVHELLQDVA